MSRAYKLALSVAAFWLLADQASKAVATALIPLGKPIVVIPGYFDLVNLRNRGAAFGFLNRDDIEWQFWLFIAATILATGVILSLLRSAARQPVLCIGLGLILGGALGNLVDRLRFRAVIDFLDFYYGPWHWPAFNLADTGICIGTGLACICLWHKPASGLDKLDESDKKIVNRL